MVALALREFASRRPDQPRPQCCVQRGFNWDEAILFEPQSKWQDAPVALFWNGPVVRVVSGLDAALEAHPSHH